MAHGRRRSDGTSRVEKKREEGEERVVELVVEVVEIVVQVVKVLDSSRSSRVVDVHQNHKCYSFALICTNKIFKTILMKRLLLMEQDQKID